MNQFVEFLNRSSANFGQFAWTMFWQSSLVIVCVLVVELVLRRKIRASIRYALWLIVLVKLLLPTSFASPTSPAWWLRPAGSAVPAPAVSRVMVTYGPVIGPVPTAAAPMVVAPNKPRIYFRAWPLTMVLSVSVGLLIWMMLRWRRVSFLLRGAVASSPALDKLLGEAREQARWRKVVRLDRKSVV